MPDVTTLWSIDWGTPTWDLFIGLFFVGAAFVYGFAMGRDRLIVLLVSTYMALAVVNYAPFVDSLGDELAIGGQVFAFQVSTFLIVFLALFFLLARSSLLHSYGGGHGSWWQVLLFGVLQAGLLISVVLSFFPPEVLAQLSEETQYLFVSEFGRFLWIGLPIVAFVFFERND